MRLFFIAFGVLVIDQLTKVVVKTRMRPGQSIDLVGDWLKFTFTENPGMAFGLEFGAPWVVTALAITATILILAYLRFVKGNHWLYRTSLALVLGGALGNIIDRIFYARIFNYGGFFRGQVVDFVHVDLWSGRLPDWVPLLGGKYFALFPIWNVADMAIVVGVFSVLIFQRYADPPRGKALESTEVASETSLPDGQPERVAVDAIETVPEA
jgi:signal peptidase II